MVDDMSVNDLHECYKNRLFPAMVQDGIVCGLLCNPCEGIYVELFANDQRSVMDRIYPGKRADQELRSLWRAFQATAEVTARNTVD